MKGEMLDLIFIINQFTHTLTEFNLRTIQFELYADKQRILAGQDLYNAMASFFYLAFVESRGRSRVWGSSLYGELCQIM